MSPRPGMYVDRHCLIVPIQTELHTDVVEALQLGILEKVRAARLRGVVIDLAGVSLLDTYQARGLFDTAKMVRLFGATTVITGLSAGIAVSLVQLGFEPGDVPTAVSLEEGIELLQSLESGSPGETGENGDPDGEESDSPAINETGEDAEGRQSGNSH